MGWRRDADELSDERRNCLRAERKEELGLAAADSGVWPKLVDARGRSGLASEGDVVFCGHEDGALQLVLALAILEKGIWEKGRNCWMGRGIRRRWRCWLVSCWKRQGKMFALLSVLLLLSQVLPLVQSQTCNGTTEYLQVSRCCKKCEPGQYLEQRCGTGSPDSQCKPCGKGYFMEDYNTNYGWCNHCTKCNKDHMKYKRNCTATSDAKCTCDEGYRCNDNKCMMCVKELTTTSVTFHPSPAPTKTAQDNVWISVSLCFACVCVCVLFTCFLLTSRHARSCGRIMSASKGFWSFKKSNSGFSQCTGEEKVSMPVQEMCGKTEKLEDV